MDMWIQWAYNSLASSDLVSPKSCHRLHMRVAGDILGYPSVHRYAMLFKLADYLGCHALMHDIEVATKLNPPLVLDCSPGAEAATYIFENFDHSHFLRKLVISQFQKHPDSKATENAHSYPLEFWSTLAMDFVDDAGKKRR